jgi:hypothetical protein
MPTWLSDEGVSVPMWPLVAVVLADGGLFGVGLDMVMSATLSGGCLESNVLDADVSGRRDSGLVGIVRAPLPE